jgi:hypothetical protein
MYSYAKHIEEVVMPKSKSRGQGLIPPAKETLQLKIALRYIAPAIWRRVVVPDNLTLSDLHDVIQIAMGWHNCHLHAFRIGDTAYMPKMPGNEIEVDSRSKNEDEWLLSHVVRRKGQKFTYEYDFGDSWLHEISVEKTAPAAEPHPKPVCIAGKRAAPPEDCGGVPGYAHVLKVLRSARTEDDRELIDWLGDYDPARFDVARINRAFAKW